MASELLITTRLRFRKGSIDTADRGVSNLAVNVAGDAYQSAVQNIGTTHEIIVIPAEIATAGYIQFRNLDPTNYIEIGLLVSGTFYPCAKMKAGEPALFRAGTNSLYAKANTAACNLEMLAVED